MAGPRIAIVGSADPTRNYREPLRSPEAVASACEQLGAALAERGCRVVVYSSDARFIEGRVIRGYCGTGRAEAGSVEVLFPKDATIDFPEVSSHPDLFHLRRDAHPEWEVSFFRSLADVDGVLLVGGGRATLTTGLISISHGTPLVTVATFGGMADRVWYALSQEDGAATPDELEAMRQDWRQSTAVTLVDALLAQVTRRKDAARAKAADAADARRQQAGGLALMTVLVLASIVLSSLGWAWEQGSAPVIAVLLAAPVLAGMAGGLVRSLRASAPGWAAACAYGAGAAFVTSLLFMAAQIAATPDILDGDGTRRLLVFVLVIGFIAGYTADLVYRRLSDVDVTHTDALTGGGSPRL